MGIILDFLVGREVVSDFLREYLEWKLNHGMFALGAFPALCREGLLNSTGFLSFFHERWDHMKIII